MTEAAVRGAWKLIDGNAAAHLVGVSAATIRKWHQRGYLQPVRPGARPSMYRVIDIQRCAATRLPKTKRDKLISGWQQITGDQTLHVQS